jgi:prevent-host-death family protein
VVRIQGEQLQETSGYLRTEVRKAPVEVTYHGRPELVVLSVEDYELLRQNRKLAFARRDMPLAKMKRIASNRMDEKHADLDALMDE